MYSFGGKVAVITGASVGIGYACAVKFAEYGASVALVDIDYEKLQGVKSELEKNGTKVEIYKCDISDESMVNKISDDIIRQFGGIDILVNNAGIWRHNSPFVDTPSDEWRRYIDVNILGTMYFTKAALKSMIAKEYGRVINVASVAGVYGNANMAHYSMTKGALIALTKALAKEVADKGITVNATSPGSVSPAGNPIDFVQESSLSFAGRTGSTEENAELICYLASDAAAYISGQNIQIDGCRKKM